MSGPTISRISSASPAFGPSPWSKRYELINDFEKMLTQNGTRILRFYLHFGPEEQLERFKERLDDKSRRWRIGEGDCSEREPWPQYVAAREDVLAPTSTKRAPWYVIPAHRKWFRNLAVLQIVTKTVDETGLKLPPTHADIRDIRRKFHAGEAKERMAGRRKGAGRGKSRRHHG